MKNRFEECPNCRTEFAVVFYNEDRTDILTEYCPKCGASLNGENKGSGLLGKIFLATVIAVSIFFVKFIFRI